MRKPKVLSSRVHFELYYQMRLRGFNVVPELAMSGVRADLAVMDNGTPIALIEVKSRRSKGGNSRSGQVAAYKATGLPVYWCCGMEGIEATLEWASSFRSVVYKS